MSTVKAKVTGAGKSFEVGEKRLYLPGVKVTAVCPECGRKVVDDLGDDYLSYPTANKAFERQFYCEAQFGGEVHEFSVTLKLNISLEVVGGAS